MPDVLETLSGHPVPDRLGRSLTILVHDYAGHPFQAELSRELARHNHRVVHAWFAQDQGPKGRLSPLAGDPPGLHFAPLSLARPYSKSNFVRRRIGDLAYGRTAAALVERVRPDLVISGNTPTEAQEPLLARCHALGIPFIFWCQDFYSIAVSHLLGKRFPGLGNAIGAYYRFLERRQMQRAHGIVHITDDFLRQTDRWAIERSKIATIPNWAPIELLPLRPRDNQWSRANSPGPGPRFLYSGTLGLKHNPDLIADLARAVSGKGHVTLVSSGAGTEMLKIRKNELPALDILPLQPFPLLADVLGSAHVLLAVIEREAGTFSVPSKILSYLCAGRPVVLAAPCDNLAARLIAQIGAGTVVEPEDRAGFVAAALEWANDPARAAAAGRSARAYAEENFILNDIADRFEQVFATALAAEQSDGTIFSNALLF